MQNPANFKVLFIAGFGPVVHDAGESRKLYRGLSLSLRTAPQLPLAALGKGLRVEWVIGRLCVQSMGSA